MAFLISRQAIRRYSLHLSDENSRKAIEGSQKLWERLALFVALPICALTATYEVMIFHRPERKEFIPYDYLAIRKKKFPWGDGNHTLFHNPKRNALPDGYEE